MTFSTMEVCRQAGVSYRQVDYWCRIGLIDGVECVGTGARRRFTVDQLRRVHFVAAAARLHAIPLGDLADLIEQGAVHASIPDRRRRTRAGGLHTGAA